MAGSFITYKTEGKYGWLSFIVIGLVAIDGGIYIQNWENEARNWPTAAALILKSEVKVHSDSDGNSYSPNIKYSYYVKEQKYIGENLYMGPTFQTSSRKSVKKQLRKYPEGRQVTVHYDPLLPSDAYLDLDSPSKLFFFCLGMIFLPAGIWLFTGVGKTLKGESFPEYFKILLIAGGVVGIILFVGLVGNFRFARWLPATLVLLSSLLIGLGTVYLSFLSLRFKRIMENIPTSKIATGAVGSNVEITGNIVGGPDSLTAPISGIPCSFYFVKIEHQDNEDKKAWATLGQFGVQPWFCVEDDSRGLALVFHEGAELHLNWTSKILSNDKAPSTPFPKVVESLQAQFPDQVLFRGLVSKGNVYRIHECVITPKDNVYIFGYAQSGAGFTRRHKAGLSPEDEQKARDKAVETREQALRWDSNQDGVIDDREMALAIETIAKEQGFQFIKEGFVPYFPRIKMVFEKGETAEQMFVLSNKGEKELVRGFKMDTVSNFATSGVVAVNSIVGFILLIL